MKALTEKTVTKPGGIEAEKQIWHYNFSSVIQPSGEFAFECSTRDQAIRAADLLNSLPSSGKGLTAQVSTEKLVRKYVDSLLSSLEMIAPGSQLESHAVRQTLRLALREALSASTKSSTEEER